MNSGNMTVPERDLNLPNACHRTQGTHDQENAAGQEGGKRSSCTAAVVFGVFVGTSFVVVLADVTLGFRSCLVALTDVREGWKSYLITIIPTFIPLFLFCKLFFQLRFSEVSKKVLVAKASGVGLLVGIPLLCYLTLINAL